MLSRSTAVTDPNLFVRSRTETSVMIVPSFGWTTTVAPGRLFVVARPRHLADTAVAVRG
jgi:hypothetical protein